MGVRLELEDLPPRYREQAERQILQRKGQTCLQKESKNTKNDKQNEENKQTQSKNEDFCKQKTKRVPESEKRYYREVILPKVACGLVVKVQEQIVFELLPEKAYCGLKLPKARYKPDFVLTYADGTVEIVEVKSKFTRRMQRDYIYRRRLFIDLIAEPRGWKFTEWFADKED